MSARKQISLEFKDPAKPSVFTLAKESVLFLLKEILPDAAKETLNDLTQIQQIPANNNFFSFVLGISSDSITVELCKNCSTKCCGWVQTI